MTLNEAVWHINNVSYVAPQVPTLVKILDGANSSVDFNTTENTFILPANKVIQVEFPARLVDESSHLSFIYLPLVSPLAMEMNCIVRDFQCFKNFPPARVNLLGGPAFHLHGVRHLIKSLYVNPLIDCVE